jgi:hypothetical protein
MLGEEYKLYLQRTKIPSVLRVAVRAVGGSWRKKKRMSKILFDM